MLHKDQNIISNDKAIFERNNTYTTQPKHLQPEMKTPMDIHQQRNVVRTLSITTTSTELLRISVSTRLRACSAQSGCEMSRFSVFTPIAWAREGSRACSASTKTQQPASKRQKPNNEP